MPARCLRSACFAAGLLAIWGALRPAALCAQSAPAESPHFSLADGDRVVLLGSTFIERAQSHGYLEAALANGIIATEEDARAAGASRAQIRRYLVNPQRRSDKRRAGKKFDLAEHVRKGPRDVKPEVVGAGGPI